MYEQLRVQALEKFVIHMFYATFLHPTANIFAPDQTRDVSSCYAICICTYIFPANIASVYEPTCAV
jgi:hypothetical protein